MKQRLISAGILLAIVITCVFVSDITRVLFFGAAGSMALPKEIFGIVERFSTYSAVIFTGIMGVYWYRNLEA